MGLKDQILSKIEKHINEKFDTTFVHKVPSIEKTGLTFGSSGKKFKATVLYIDLRSSTALINNHNKSTVAKIHKAYYYTIVKIAKSLNGENRSFNGDSLLIFFEGNSKDALSNAVKSAMMMNYMLSDKNGITKHLKKYTKIDYGIGIDYGNILSTKVGIGGTGDNKDLIWIGNAVNKSTVLSDEGESPHNIHISKVVYNNLNDDVKFHNSKDMWKKTSIEYNGERITCYYTVYQWSVV